ncbi:MAG: flagellin [Gammaproteobacteria bacterium]|jgi:flagellin|nr:flagellin [Gammaproteobacteria bacterium]
MPSVVNTNVLSLNAQRNLSRSDSTLSTALQRLSSGLRINSAKDDAAGLAIADRFTTQIRGLNQAVRNANDGISLSQTAESALDELGNNLQRIRELAVQSANATNSASDRAALDQEVQQRIAEINRIATQTSFNGQKVLDGSFGSAQFQVGANVGETIGINLTTGVRADQLGQIATSTGTAVTANALTDGGLTIAVGQGAAVSIGASAPGSQVQQTADSAYAKVNAINAAGVSGLTATATNTVTGTFSTITNASAASTYNLTVNGIAIYSGTGNIADGGSLTAADVSAQINLFSTQTGVSAAVSGTSLTLTAADGRNIVVAETITAGGGATLAGTGIAAAQEGTLRGTVTLSAAQNITLGGANADIGFAGTSIAVDDTTLSTVNVTSVSDANTAIQRVDAALTAVSSLRSQLGAIQNRFESTIANLSSVSENLTASRSRIQDADFAAETAALTRAQILQQAGVAVLAQANAAPQTVLGLFR